MPDGRLKLIDGHLRRDLDPMTLDVEVLDVNEEEARTLLLSIDPLAALAETQEQLHERLLTLTPAACPELEAGVGGGGPGGGGGEAGSRGRYRGGPAPGAGHVPG
jgi:hypothetical protein